MLEHLIAAFLGKVQVQQNKIRRRSAFVGIGGVEIYRGGVAVTGDVDIGIDPGAGDCLAYEQYVRPVVLDDQDSALPGSGARLGG